MRLTDGERQAAIIRFAQKLVQTPSQGGVDSPAAILDLAHDYGRALGLPAEIITDPDTNEPVALVALTKGGHPGKTWCLNSCIDTAPAGEEKLWSFDRFSGEVVDGKLQGRGAADSKIAVSIFMHLAQELHQQADRMHGDLLLLFDADEHTGNFGGIKAALNQGYKPDGIIIGYPGKDELIVGARGFSRYRIVITGKGGHSGSNHLGNGNSLVNELSQLSQRLCTEQPKGDEQPDFPRKPQATVTRLQAGESFSNIPSKGLLEVDVRLTPDFNETAADAHIQRLVKEAEEQFESMGRLQITINKVGAEPPYVLTEQSLLRKAMLEAIMGETGRPALAKICAPSNIGNYLTRHGIEATAGFGVGYENLHGFDEVADTADVTMVYKVHRRALSSLLKLDR